MLRCTSGDGGAEGTCVPPGLCSGWGPGGVTGCRSSRGAGDGGGLGVAAAWICARAWRCTAWSRVWALRAQGLGAPGSACAAACLLARASPTHLPSRTPAQPFTPAGIGAHNIVCTKTRTFSRSLAWFSRTPASATPFNEEGAAIRRSDRQYISVVTPEFHIGCRLQLQATQATQAVQGGNLRRTPQQDSTYNRLFTALQLGLGASSRQTSAGERSGQTWATEDHGNGNVQPARARPGAGGRRTEL